MGSSQGTSEARPGTTLDTEGAKGDGDDISQVVLEAFSRLPARRKPCLRSNGIQEWVPLSGIVARGTTAPPDRRTCQE